MISNEIEPILRSTLVELISKHNVTRFYVGNHGAFDSLVFTVLRSLSLSFEIQYYVVLAYLPAPRQSPSQHTLLPEGIEKTPRRFAVCYRNKWMIDHSDYVITFVTHDLGSGAAKFKTISEKRGKVVIEISQKTAD